MCGSRSRWGVPAAGTRRAAPWRTRRARRRGSRRARAPQTARARRPRAAGAVDDHRVLPHPRELAAPIMLARLAGERQVERQVIDAGQQLVERRASRPLEARRPRRQQRVAGDDGHAEGARASRRRGRCDRSRRARASCRSARGPCTGSSPLADAHVGGGVGEMALEREQEAEGQLGDGDRVRRRRVPHLHTPLFATATSTLSSPVPARTTSLSVLALRSTSAVTLVAPRTMIA